MKISEAWLHTWIDFDADTQALSDRLTMSGLEVDAITPAAGEFSSVVVGRIVALDQHPDADKLSVCRVDSGQGELAQIVCGASNVYVGMHAPLALIGARLPGGLKIKKSRLRGVESQGMLCSDRELGFGDDHGGIMDLHGAGEPGEDLRTLLDLDDQVIDVDLTPNRSDCLGMEGIARDVAAAFRVPFTRMQIPSARVGSTDKLAVEIQSPDSCPRYAGRVVKNIDPDSHTPIWIIERIRRAGIRPIHPVVDVTNYVMLELGQPMHAFDLRQLRGGIVVRRARKNESLTLLDGQLLSLAPETTVIADHEKALAIAGVMGGEFSGVANDTRDVFLESAFFSPEPLAGVARSFGLHTDASHRFERGVDATLQERALERATALLIEIAGGDPGPVTVAESREHLPKATQVRLRAERLERVTGATIPKQSVSDILKRLGMEPVLEASVWTVQVPPHRFDIAIEEDLIEEVARIYGFDEIPETPGQFMLAIDASPEEQLPVSRLKGQLVARGYNEAVTYSFVDPGLQSALFPDTAALTLDNPIASNLADMRVSLWPGLLVALRDNLSHREARVRLFESGMRFVPEGNDIKQDNVFSGLIAGRRFPEQWSADADSVDFYDLKGDVESLLALTGDATNFMFNSAAHPALHPGRSASLARNGRTIGWLGELHPAHVRMLDLDCVPQMFEIELLSLTDAKLPVIATISRYPEIRRDIAMLVPESVSAAEIEAAALHDKPELLKSLFIFDVYRGGNIDSGLKSVALGLILQESSRTLTDHEADSVVAHVTDRLEKKVRARIRG